MDAATLSLVRASRGPVQLVVLGVVFLLSNYQIAEISKTWSVLLITYGVMRLLAWTGTRAQKPNFPAAQ
jgi:hypothetical protein